MSKNVRYLANKKRAFEKFEKWNLRYNVESYLSFLSVYPRAIPVPFPFDFVLSDFARVHLRHFPDATPSGENSIPYSQHAPIFTKSFYRFHRFPLSLFSLPSSHLPASFCNPSDSGCYPSAGIRNERTREKTNFESGCLKGRKSSGRRRAKGRKNIPESSVESTSIHRFQMISSLSIFYHRRV